MITSYYHRLYAYNRWANYRVLESVAALSQEEFTRDLKSSFPSIRDTLVHMMGAEWIWLMRWNGVSPRSLPNSDDITSLDVLRGRWRDIETEQAAFIADLTEDALYVSIRYTNTRGEEWEFQLGKMLSHVVNHATYHRGQVATMLRQLDRQPVSTDLIFFSDGEAS